MFDLNLLPLNFFDGQEQAGMPELFATASPRRTARGRSGDQLVILLNLQGSAPLSPAGHKQLLERLSHTFYQTSGSVTAGLRAASEALNQYLLDRNLHITSAGRQALGLINMLVVHNDQIILAQCGPTHAFILADKAIEHFTDPQLAGRGLGLSRTLTIRFYQTEATAGKCLVLCPEPPMQWNTILSGGSGQTLETLRRRLLSAQQANLSAVLIQFQAGSGKINLVPSQPASTVRETSRIEPVGAPVKSGPPTARNPGGPDLGKTAVSIPTQAQRQPASQPNLAQTQSSRAQNKDKATPKSPRENTISPIATTAPVTTRALSVGTAPTQSILTTPPTPEAVRPGAAQSLPAQTRTPAPTPSKAGATAGQSRPPLGSRVTPQPAKTSATGEPIIQEMKRTRQTGVFIRALASSWVKTRNALQAGIHLVQMAVARMMPTPAQPVQGLSMPSMVAIAVAVPLIVVAVAMVVYIKKGQGELFRAAFSRAQAAANETLNQTDPLVMHNAWDRTLTLLSTAEAYQTTDETQALRSQAQTSVDLIDDVTRLNFQNAIVGGLDNRVQVIHMIATANDLYMLDASQGRVIRAVLTGRGYEVDPSFICGPGRTGSLIIGPLVSIAPLPLNNLLKASIIALDQSGNLLYCLPSGPAYAIQLAPPDNNWGKIESFVYNADTLYVLDSANNSIEVYTSKNGSFNERPHLYFDNNVPNLKDAIDLAINDQDIYMLHSDGHMSVCVSSQVVFVPTRCSDPAPYTDPRAGRDHNPTTFKEGQFNQLLFTAPPDPSIYLLFPDTASIYHFSLRLNLQRLLRPQLENMASLPSGKATAFTIGISRNAFLAFGNQVMYASIP